MGGGGESPEQAALRKKMEQPARPTWSPEYSQQFLSQLQTPKLAPRYRGEEALLRGDVGRLREIAEGGEPVAPSRYAEQLLGQERLMTQGARERAQQQQLGAAAQAQQQLGMFGGLTGGARERIARGSAQRGVQTLQDIARQSQARRLGISAEDLMKQQAFQQRVQMGMPGVEQSRLAQLYGVEAKDVEGQRRTQEQALQLGMERFKAEQESWAAERQAIAEEVAASQAGK